MFVSLRHQMQFFSRPLIGPEITWSVPGLSLVNPPPWPLPPPGGQGGGGGGLTNERPGSGHMWPEGQWEASKKTALDGANRHTDGHGDSMTNSAQWGRVGENAKWELPINLSWLYLSCIFFIAFSAFTVLLIKLFNQHIVGPKLIYCFGNALKLYWFFYQAWSYL